MTLEVARCSALAETSKTQINYLLILSEEGSFHHRLGVFLMILKTQQKAALVLATLMVLSKILRAEEPPAKQQANNRETVRKLLDEGQKNGALPPGFFVRVHAHQYHAKEEAQAAAKKRGEVLEEPFKEAWEFTSTDVHRVVYDPDRKKQSKYRRLGSLPFDSKSLCQELLDGKLLEIGTGKGTGEPTQYVGSDYELGGRAIEIYRNDETEPLLELYEHCTGPGYPESDARAFGELYEKLARQGRQAFKTDKN
jgi:hypothetical protein